MSDTLPLPAATSSLSPPPDRWAQVRVAERVTRYVRRGAGHPVLLLREQRDESPLWPALVDALAAHHRVILPETPEGGAGWSAWVRGFIDGVGCLPVTLIAAGEFCLPALELALLDTDRLARLVLVPCGGADETGLTGALATRPRARALPVLVVRRESPAGEAVAMVEEFIAGALGGFN